MNSKERVLAAAQHQVPDRVPTIVNLAPPVAEKLNAMLGNRFEKEPMATLNTLISGRASYNALLLELGNDCIGVAAASLPEHMRQVGDVLFDEWGMGYRRIHGYLEVVSRPLENAACVADADAFAIPDPRLPGRWTEAKRLIAAYGDQYAVMGCMGQTLFETCWNLIGFEKFLMDFCTEEPYLLRMLDRLTQYALAYVDELMRLGCDIIFLGDDVGTQNHMLISAASWRGILKPRLAVICEHIRRNSRAQIAYHSCGSIVPIIDDLVELGVSILNPVQPLAAGMDLAALKRQYGDKLCFYGAIDVQQCIPSGTVEDVKAQVRDAIKAGAGGGGYIVAPAHIVPAETKPENVLAFFEAVRQYGACP